MGIRMEDHSEKVTPLFSGLPNEIMLQILDKLDNQSLLRCRVVNKGWCEASSFILQSRPTLIVWFLLCEGSEMESDSVTSFIECFKKSQQFFHTFPYVNFQFGGFNDYISKSPVIQSFFALTEESSDSPRSALQIKSLRFDDVKPLETELNMLEHLIFERTPQLRTLSLCIRYDHWKSQPSQSQACVNTSQTTSCDDVTSPGKERKLLSLQVIQQNVEGTVQVDLWGEILRAAPNIQRIGGLDAHDWHGFKGSPYHIHYPNPLKLLIDTNKLHLVHQCDILIHDDLAISGLLDRKKLSGFQPKLLSLVNHFGNSYARTYFTRNFEQIKSGLREVLWAVKDSVEELRSRDGLGIVDKNSLPCFSKLERLRLDANLEGPIFPPGIRDRNDVFPKLEKIHLSHIPVIPSVHALEIKPRGPFTGLCLESMAFMCPNVRRLELSCNYSPRSYTIDFKQVGPLIWTNMTGLKILRLYHMFWKGIELMDHFEAGFTGFSLETVRQLRAAAPEDRPKVEEVEQHLRVNPSILQMTELEKLILNLWDKRQVPAFPLSFKYAFDLMPGLTVDISSPK